MKSVFKTFVLILTLFGLQSLAFAQTPIKVEEGFDYRVLPIAQPIDVKGKVEVIEFFWYGCPHCFEFEPDLKAWLKRQNKDVVFKKVPIAFRDELMPHSLLFY
ncbi:MAG: thiol:disulfide interchange protein DsbA/DsbL, partial [Burkholderiaceae bacterium]|nr:thiol:disulfide interchange protein DsbA/DsbL [Burkholderiaceae bacterium]